MKELLGRLTKIKIIRKSKIKIPRARKALKGINSGERKYIIKKKNVSNGNVRIGSPSVQNVCPCSSSHLTN